MRPIFSATFGSTIEPGSAPSFSVSAMLVFQCRSGSVSDDFPLCPCQAEFYTMGIRYALCTLPLLFASLLAAQRPAAQTYRLARGWGVGGSALVRKNLYIVKG